MKPRDMFLVDEEKLFTRLVEQAAALQVQPLLRLLHTIKGNANAFGIKQITIFSHVLESFLGNYAHYAPEEFSASEKKIILDAAIALNDALVVLRADPQASVGFKELAKNMTLVLKAKSEASGVAQGASRMPLPSKPTNDYALCVQVGGQHCLLPVQTVVEVIYRPDIIPVTGSFLTAMESSASIAHAKLVRFRGRLMPLLSPEALLNEKHQSSENTPIFSSGRITIPWAIILKDPEGGVYRNTWFCLPVDDVITIAQRAKLQSEHFNTSLSFERIRDTVNKLHPAA